MLNSWTLWGVSLTTMPLLVAVGTLQILTEEMIHLGLWSEEIFRGDRLPVLPFPEKDQEG